ncbi:LPXTG cell wall anchor domain-containing protein [Actinokineospora guangxiensis]|uniref:LPXTG cell wall anchor domain-containing protein n=1 Tax=Actinokineospora guangxiensis TaxID=1490288 RepID=A0ABW0ENJ3_9PSEU
MSGRRTAAGFAIALALVAAGAPAATAQDEAGPHEVAAGWLAGQLVDGDHMETTFDGTAYPDHGLTADVVLALNAAGSAQDFAAAATEWLAANAKDYVGDGTTSAYAGAHAKLAIVAQAQGADPADFGGVDLIGGLTALQAESGRFSDKSEYGDFSNGISQSLAVLALHRSGGAPEAAVKYLVDAECEGGGFPLELEKETCAADVDTTGYAVQALAATGADVTSALTWLGEQQKDNGGFEGSGPTAVVNANSTGLAATALAAGGDQTGADKAIAYLLKQQVDCAGKAETRGAVAYDASGFDAATAARATSQAIPGITGVSLADITAEGATAEAVVLACAAPPTTTTTTVPATPTSTTPPVADKDELARTGAEPGPTAAFGGLLLLAGAGLVFLARRRSTS